MKNQLYITFEFSWWFRLLYLPILLLVCKLFIIFGLTPEINDARFRYWARKAIKLKSNHRRLK
jgi:hypothetical protein